jgi:hypothetical protein
VPCLFCPRAYPPCPSLWLPVLLLPFPVGVFLLPVFPGIEWVWCHLSLPLSPFALLSLIFRARFEFWRRTLCRLPVRLHAVTLCRSILLKKHFWTKFYVNPALLGAGRHLLPCLLLALMERGSARATGHRGQGHRGRGHRRCPYTIACHPASLS